MENLYEVLGVSKTSTLLEIKTAFRTLAKETHPDLNGGDSEKQEQFKKVFEAYSVLSNPKSRVIYDDHFEIFQNLFDDTGFEEEQWEEETIWEEPWDKEPEEAWQETWDEIESQLFGELEKKAEKTIKESLLLIITGVVLTFIFGPFSLLFILHGVYKIFRANSAMERTKWYKKRLKKEVWRKLGI